MRRHIDIEPLPDPEFLNDVQAAALLGVALATIRKWRVYRSGPPCYKIGSCVRYKRDELLKWATAKRADAA